MHWRRKWQPTPVFLSEESQGWGSWWAAVYGVSQSRAQLKGLSSSSSSDEHCFWRQRPRFDFGSNPSYLCNLEQEALISLILSFLIWKMGLIIICQCWCHGICCDICLICLLGISSPSFCTNGSPLSYGELFQYNPSGTTQLISSRVSGCHDLFTLKTFRIPNG